MISIFDIVTKVMKAHCGQEGGSPTIDWYRLRSDLVSELNAVPFGLTADQLCMTPLIECLVPTSEEWGSCEFLQDRNDLIKRRVRLAFSRAALK